MTEHQPYPVPVENPTRFEGPRHKEVVLALAREAMQRDMLEKLAITDELTKLMNKRAYENAIQKRIVEHQFDNQPLALMIVDLNKFKQVNDTLGHAKGDEALRDVAGVLSQLFQVREGEQAFRIGGDEFAIIAVPQNEQNDKRKKNLTSDEIMEGLAHRIQSEVSSIAEVIGIEGFGASVGWTFYQPGDTPESLYERADAAMYNDKQAHQEQTR